MYGILVMLLNKYQEKTEGTIKDGQSRETGSIVHTRHKMKIKKMQHNMWWRPLCVNKHKKHNKT